MPHIVVEYSENMDDRIRSSALLSALHEHVVASGLFAPEAVKARATLFRDFVLTPPARSFVHVTVSILRGRPEDARVTLRDGLFELLSNLVPADRISCEIREMDPATYRKN